ncbi:MAG TPA: DUF87 domain-containing protein [Allosphingosinicella sp.]
MRAPSPADSLPILGVTEAGGPLAVDVDQLIGSHACVIANSGGGKSGLIRRLCEVTGDRIQRILFDPEDEFYTLRQRGDYVIAGGDGADVALSEASAGPLAQEALRHGFSLILQLNEYGADAPDVAAALLAGLMAAPKELWHPVLVVIDEAQRFVSPKMPTPALPAVTDLVNRGRKRGFTAVLASLRLADAIAPEIRGMVNNWLLGRVGQTLDRNAMAEQLGFTAKEGRERLRGLEPRQFWGIGPAIATEPIFFRVSDAETTVVHSGQARIPTPPAPEALRAILEGLTAAPADAPIVAGADPALAAENRRLKVEVEQLRAASAELDQAKLKLDAIGQILADDGPLPTLVIGDPPPEVMEEIRRSIEHAGGASNWEAPPPPLPRSGGGEARATGKRQERASPIASAPPPQRTAATDDVSLARGRKALEPLAGIYPAGVTQAQWATIAGFAKTGGTWKTYRGALLRAGYVEQRDGLFHATEAGLAAAGVEPQPLPPPGPDLARFWGERIPGARKMVDMLAKRWPHFVTKEGLAADLGMAADGGTFKTYLGRIRSNGLLEEQKKRVRLTVAVMGEAS